MINLDDRHASLLDDLSRQFRLSAEDTARMAIRFTHDRMKKKPDKLSPEFKPRTSRKALQRPDDAEPQGGMEP
jgi:hypothetical protein